MGQYYRFANIDKKEICEKNRQGLKLMEHSFLGNYYCNDILNLLSKEWKGDRVIHIGDYAEPEDKTTTQDIVKNIINELNIKNDSLYNYCFSFQEVESNTKDVIRYVYNLDKKEYVDLFKQPIEWYYADDNELGATKINSFALLIGCGNELGGGDYHGINKEYVGYWAGDRFVSSKTPLKEYEDYKMRNELYFEKGIYDNIKNYDLKIISNIENKLLKEEFDYIKKYLPNIDINKLILDDYGLLEEEIVVLENTLQEEKNKDKEVDL